jgi:hypothetical protein
MTREEIHYTKLIARSHAGGFWMFFTAANCFCLYLFMQTALGLLPATAIIPGCYAFSLVGFFVAGWANYTGITALWLCKKHGIDY